MDVDEFWIIFHCNLVWIIRSVRPWIREHDADIILLCAVVIRAAKERFSFVTHKNSQVCCIVCRWSVYCQINYWNVRVDTYSHLQTSPGLWMWIQSESARGAKSTWPWWTPSTRTIAYHGERLHWATEVTLLQEKTVESSSLVKLLSTWNTSPRLRLEPNTPYAWTEMKTRRNQTASSTTVRFS